MANRIAASLIVLSLVAPALSADPVPPADDATEPQLPPSRWGLKEGAPPGVSLVLERMKRQRQREFDARRRAIERAERDLAARKAGRVVKQLKAPQRWRAVPGRAGGDAVEFTFRSRARKSSKRRTRWRARSGGSQTLPTPITSPSPSCSTPNSKRARPA